MKRIAEFLLLAALVGFLLIKGILPAWNEVHSDFANYYVSAKLVTDGQPIDSLYDNAWFQKKIIENGIDTPGKFAPFPPITAWMMTPFTFFSPLAAQRIFTLINLLFLAGCVWLMQKITEWKMTYCAIFFLGGGLSIVNNIAFGQVYGIMTFFILLSIFLLQKNPVLAGMSLGVFSALKYFPIVFSVGYFLNGLNNNRVSATENRHSIISSSDSKLAFSSLLTLVVLIILQFLFFGTAVMNEFLTTVFIPHLDGHLTGQGLYSFQFQSWDNFFRILFIANAEFNPSPFVDWPNGKTVCKIIIVAFVTGLTAYTLYRCKDLESSLRRSVFLGLLSLTALVILPASATYHFVLLVIPLTLLLREHILDHQAKIILLVAYGLIGFIPYGLAFRLAASFGLFFAYPRLWLISVMYFTVVVSLLNRTISFSQR